MQRNELRTERLVLRPFEIGDVDAVLSYRDDEEFVRFLPHIPQPFTREDAEEFVAHAVSASWERVPIFAVVLDGTVIGAVNLEVNSDTRTADLGYSIGRVWWGRGYALEAARALMAWGIETFGLVRITAATDPENLRSQQVMERLGMSREAVLAGSRVGRDGEPLDEVVYALELRAWIERNELRTERLLLRPFEVSDVDDALAYRNDPEFARFLPHIPQPFTRRHAEEFIALNMSEPWEQSPTFAIVLDGTVIGTVNFEVEPGARTAMIGYAIGRVWWGRGIATEAARAAMAWAIEAFDLVRIWASTDAGNVRSQRVLEKLGMRREEVRAADHMGRDGELVDEVVYGLDLGSPDE